MSWRPANETPEDIAREFAAAQQINKAWKYTVEKLSPGLYEIDWAFLAGTEIIGFGEFKWRGEDQYDSLLLGCAKVWKLKDLSEKAGVNSLIFVQWKDGLWWADIHKIRMSRPIWGGSNRGQNGDKEPCYKLPMSFFERVK